MADARTKTPHRDRKDPGERERQNERRHAKNAARGKAVWVPDAELTEAGEIRNFYAPRRKPVNA